MCLIQAEEGKRKFIPIDKQERKTLTMDEIEEIRKKRDKHKKGDDKKKEKGEREEGEVGSDDEHEPRSKKSRRRSRSRTPQRKTRKLSRYGDQWPLASLQFHETGATSLSFDRWEKNSKNSDAS